MLYQKQVSRKGASNYILGTKLLVPALGTCFWHSTRHIMIAELGEYQFWFKAETYVLIGQFYMSETSVLRGFLCKSFSRPNQILDIYFSCDIKKISISNYVSTTSTQKLVLDSTVKPRSVIVQCGAVITLYNMPWCYTQYCNHSSRTLIRLWTHKRHHIPRPNERDMGCLLWEFRRKLTTS